MPNPQRPDLEMVGTAGRTGDRWGHSTPSVFRQPLFTCGNTMAMVVKLICELPATTSRSVGTLPLWEMCEIWAPVRGLKISAARWPLIPGAAET